MAHKTSHVRTLKGKVRVTVEGDGDWPPHKLRPCTMSGDRLTFLIPLHSNPRDRELYRSTILTTSLSMRSIRTVTMTFRRRRRAVRCNVGSFVEDDEDEEDDEDAVDPSWSIYEQEGNKCVICLGTGYDKCLFCFGKGTVQIGPEPGRDTETCPMCQGETKLQCMRCEGSGVRPSTCYDVKTGTYVRNWTNAEIASGLWDPVPVEEEDPDARSPKASESEALNV